MMLDSPPSESRAVYYPPADSVIDDYAQQVCQTLGAGYDDPDVINGLANFLKVIAKAQANVLNRAGGSQVDTPIQ